MRLPTRSSGGRKSRSGGDKNLQVYLTPVKLHTQCIENYMSSGDNIALILFQRLDYNIYFNIIMTDKIVKKHARNPIHTRIVTRHAYIGITYLD